MKSHYLTGVAVAAFLGMANPAYHAVEVARTCDLMNSASHSMCFVPGSNFTAIVETYYDRGKGTDVLGIKMFKARGLSAREILNVSLNELLPEQGEGYFMDVGVDGTLDAAIGKSGAQGMLGTMSLTEEAKKAYRDDLQMLSAELEKMVTLSRAERR